MTPDTRKLGAGSDWIQPPDEQQGIGRYLETVRERLWLVILLPVLATAVAVAYVATTEKAYEAEAGILVTPVPPEAETLVAVGLIPRSADPAREIQTVASLVTTNEVAVLAQERLAGIPEAEGEAEDLLRHVNAEPVAESNLVAVTADAGDADDAATIANVFVESLIAQRTNELHQRVAEQLEQLKTRLPSDRGGEIAPQIAQLESLATSEDPTIQLATRAVASDAPVSPRPALSIAGGMLAGLILGIAAAFVYQALDPVLRREEQLRRLYRLPILARIPKEARGGSADVPLSPTSLSPAVSEAYRTLRGTLSVASGSATPAGRAILVTGSSPSEGKTTTAVNLATSFAASGRRVILIEADLRRPSIGRAMKVRPEGGVVSVLIENKRLTESLETSTIYGPSLGLLLADYEGEWISELFALPAARRMVDEARQLADVVVIDSPPLTDIVDALPLAEYADEVLLVARLGRTRISKLTHLGELLAENGIQPVGFALVGTSRPTRSDYHYYGENERRLFASSSRGTPSARRERT